MHHFREEGTEHEADDESKSQLPFDSCHFTGQLFVNSKEPSPCEQRVSGPAQTSIINGYSKVVITASGS